MLKSLFKRRKRNQTLGDAEEDFRLKKAPKSQQESFDNAVSFATAVLEETRCQPNIYRQNDLKGNEHPLLDVVRLIGKDIQTKYLTSLLYHKDETSLPSLYADILFFDEKIYLTTDGKTMCNLKKEIESSKEIYLNKDLILPWPWKRERLINTICNIGEDRRWGDWKQDFHNHYVELWLPLGIAWVQGGNHSIASGILQGQGTLVPDKVYDVSELYNHVYTDGKNYYRQADNSIIHTVKDINFAVIYEVGRMLQDNFISF